AMFQGTWLLASWTAFKPGSIRFLAPALAVVSLLGILALTRPAADLFTAIARRIDRAWQRRAPGTLLSAPVIFGGAIATAIGAGYLIWVLLVSRRMPDASPGLLASSVAGGAACVLAHAAWRGPRLVRAIGGAVIAVGAITAM